MRLCAAAVPRGGAAPLRRELFSKQCLPHCARSDVKLSSSPDVGAAGARSVVVARVGGGLSRRSSRDSSAGRASDRRSEGPRFDPGSRHCRRLHLHLQVARQHCVLWQPAAIHVPHSTNRAKRRLTSEVGRDSVHSAWYGRQRLRWELAPGYLHVLRGAREGARQASRPLTVRWGCGCACVASDRGRGALRLSLPVAK